MTESTTSQSDQPRGAHEGLDVPDADRPTDAAEQATPAAAAEDREGADPEAIHDEAGLAEAAIAHPDEPAGEADPTSDVESGGGTAAAQPAPAAATTSAGSESGASEDFEGGTVSVDSESGAAAATDSGSEDEATEQSELDRLENEGDIAADYLEELLDIADLDGDLDMDVEGDRAAVSIVGGDVRQLVGRDGEVLEALQELTRLAVHRETGERSRLMLDIGGFRADKRSRLEVLAAEAVAEVQQAGQRKALAPMSPFERKVVHDVVAAAGLGSASEGVEPKRYVVVLPA